MMFNTFLLCVAMVQAIQAILTSDSSIGRLEDISSGANTGRYSYQGLLRKVKESGLHLPARSDILTMDAEAAEENLMEDYSLVDPRVTQIIMAYKKYMALSMEASSREERSPRRCVQLLESCVGHLPCCSPCATCYCRFFNAICYCRKTSTNCHQSKN